MRTLRVFAFLLFVPLVVACAGDGDSGEPSANGLATESGSSANEDDLARSMLLELDDFPQGWAEELEEDAEDDDAFSECRSEPAGLTGRAETGDFSRGGSATVSQQVSIFDAVDDVSAAFGRVQSVIDCVVDLFNDGEVDADEVAYKDATVSRVSFPDYGDGTEAYRLMVRAKVRGETGFGSEPSVFIDLVNVVVGRVGFTVQVSDVLTPFDTAQIEDFVSTATTKVQRLLAEGGDAADWR